MGFISDLFGGGDDDDGLPGYLKDGLKDIKNRAKKESLEKFTPYKRDMVANVNQSQKNAGKTLNSQRQIMGENVGQADAMLDRIAPTAKDYYKGVNPNTLDAARKKAETRQLGTNKNLTTSLNRSMRTSTAGYDQADNLVDQAAKLSGTNKAAIKSRMNPYEDLVTKNTLRDYGKQRNIAGNALEDSARQAGAFGGSRHGVAQGMFDQETSKGQQDIIADANAANYNAAIGQLNADRNNLLASAGQKSGIRSAQDAGQMGYASNISGMAGQDAALLRQGSLDVYGAKKDLADSRRSQAQDLYENQLGWADAQTKLGQADQASRQALAADQLGYGDAMRDIRQQDLDAQRAEWDRKQNWDKEQINFYASSLAGNPYKPTQTNSGGGLGNALIGGASTLVSGLLSDETKKENRSDTDDEAVLKKFAGMPVDDYTYKPEVVASGEAPAGERTGPMAQDWAKEFGGDGETIDMWQMMGKMASAIKGLEARTQKETLPRRKAA